MHCKCSHSLALLPLLLMACPQASAQGQHTISNGHVTASVMFADDGAYGFRVTAGEKTVTEIAL